MAAQALLAIPGRQSAGLCLGSPHSLPSQPQVKPGLRLPSSLCLSRISRSSHSLNVGRHGTLQSVCSASATGTSGVGSSSKALSESVQGIEILKSDGTPVPLVSLWEDRKAVVAWVRHYGCLLCRKRAASLAAMKPELDALGVSLAVIGPASVEQAATFLQQTDFPGEVYADPTHKSFEALQFAYGPQTVLNPKAGVNLIQARMEGFQQDWGLSLKEDTVNRGGWQQGGVLVAGPGAKTISFLHKDKEAGDEPNWDLVKAVANE